MADEQLVRLSGSDRVALPGFSATEAWNADDRVSVTVYVRPNPDLKEPPDPTIEALKPLDQRRYVEKKDVAAYFGASSGDLNAVADYAQAQGLEVNELDAAARSVRLTGTTAAMNATFGVELKQFEDTRSRRSYRGREGAVHVPASLAEIVEGVFGLDNRPIGRSYLRTGPDTFRSTGVHAAGEASEHVPKLPANTYYPPTVGELYEFPTEADGTGQTIGILAFNNQLEEDGEHSEGGYKPALIAAYFHRILKLSPPTITDVTVHGPGNVPGDGSDPADSSGEVYLDLCMAGSLAPGARIVMYFTEFTEQGWVDAIHAAVTDTSNAVDVLSISYGNPEHDPGRSAWTTAAVRQVNHAFKIAAATGMTICCAAGDDGSADEPGTSTPHADFPASSPWVLGCGGTRLHAAGATINSETVWNDLQGGHGATGGGVSRVFTKPKWQEQVTVPPVPGRTDGRSGRGVPDVAAVADPETPLAVLNPDGSVGGVGGTSAASPLWAALTARLNQALQHPVGYLNPSLYAHIGDGVFHDITDGNNGSFDAGVGWDACTGFGSPNGTALLNALRAFTE